jgi:hypothetical protein
MDGCWTVERGLWCCDPGRGVRAAAVVFNGSDQSNNARWGEERMHRWLLNRRQRALPDGLEA